MTAESNGGGGFVPEARRSRQLLGDLKFRLVDRWPYAFLKARGQRRRAQYRGELTKLPAIQTSRAPADVEIHMLCGRAQADMGIWASWSLMRFFANPRLYVHSDGTLTAAEEETWKKTVPTARFIGRSEAEERFMTELGHDLPALARWRAGYWSSQQVIDFHLFGEATSLVGMDSDVLCFQRPAELADALSEPGQAFRWTRDLPGHCYYSASVDLLESISGCSVPDALNCGFLVCPRLTKPDFVFLDRMIEALESASVDIFHWAMGQTLLALIAGRHGRSTALPAPYDVRFGKTSPDVRTRHYVGLWKIRPRYFTEGLPRLLRDVAETHPLAQHSSMAEVDTASIR